MENMTDCEIMKAFYVLGLYGTSDVSFVKSILERVYIKGNEPTEKQIPAIQKSIQFQRMKEKLTKYDLTGASFYMVDEIDFDDEEKSDCCITNERLEGKCCIIRDGELYSIDAYKTNFQKQKQKQTKQKVKLSELI